MYFITLLSFFYVILDLNNLYLYFFDYRMSVLTHCELWIFLL